jgi:hypothetical protein
VSRFLILLARTRFRRFRGCQVPFSCFACPNSFSAVPRMSSPVFLFCAPGLVYGVPGASGPVFMFCSLGLIFGGTEGVVSRFHDLCSRTRFRRCRVRRVPFSRFARPYSFSAVTRATLPIFMLFAPGLIFGGAEGVVSRFHVLCFRTHFRRHRGRRIPFSCFALPNSFSAVPRASNPVFMFCATRLIFSGTKGVGSRFYVLRGQNHFRRYRGRWVSFSSFALLDSYSTVPRASGPVFIFCAR